jgi:hypothetical protein
MNDLWPQSPDPGKLRASDVPPPNVLERLGGWQLCLLTFAVAAACFGYAFEHPEQLVPILGFLALFLGLHSVAAGVQGQQQAVKKALADHYANTRLLLISHGREMREHVDRLDAAHKDTAIETKHEVLSLLVKPDPPAPPAPPTKRGR